MKTGLKGPKQRKAFRDNYLAAVIAVAALLLSSVAYGQNPTRGQLQQINATGYDYKSIAARGHLYVPLDTLSTSDSGAIAYLNGVFYVKNSTHWTSWGKAVKLNDSTFTISGDTIQLAGGSGGDGNSGTDNANVGSGYRILIPGTQEIKTVFPGWGQLIDSSTNTNALTMRPDSTHFSTIGNRTKGLDSLSAELRDVIADTAGAIRADFAVTNTRVAFGDANNQIADDADFTFNSTSKRVTVGATTIGSGTPGSNRVELGTRTDGVRTLPTISFYNPHAPVNNRRWDMGVGSEWGGSIFDTIFNISLRNDAGTTLAIPFAMNRSGDSINLITMISKGVRLYGELDLLNKANINGPVRIDSMATGSSGDSVVVRASDGTLKKVAQSDITGGGGTSGISEVVADFGLINVNDSTLQVDSLELVSWERANKIADSLSGELRDVIADTALAIRNDFPSGGANLVKDLGAAAKSRPLSESKIYAPAKGVASNDTVTNYSYASLDSTKAYYSTTALGAGGREFGGWLAAGTSGDSIRVTVPYGVLIGDSQAEGHSAPTDKHGRLHAGGGANFQWDYPDSVGQISYHLRGLTKMRWFNHGIGGQTTAQVRARFYRDVFAYEASGATLFSTRTLLQKPQVVVIIAGINDVFNGMTVEQTKENLLWMAAACQREGVRCVILNLPGDAISNQTHLRKIAEINEWMASGIFDQFECSIVDYNTWWNDPAYGNDNVHHTSLIADDIHPSPVGYDSLANYIFREAKLPVLTQATFYMELDPGGFTGYSRPTSIAINNVSYSLTGSTATIDITDYVPDSVWIRIDASTNISGTTFTGFNHIVWTTDNNAAGVSYYTQRRNFTSGTDQLLLSKIRGFSPTQLATADRYTMLDFRHYDSTYKTLSLVHTGGAGEAYINFGTSALSPIISGATLNVTGAVAASGIFHSTGTLHRFGNSQIGNGKATSTGYGIAFNTSLAGMDFNNTIIAGKPTFLFSTWNNATNASMGSTSGMNTDLVRIGLGIGDAANTNLIVNALAIKPTWNQTNAVHTGMQVRDLYISSVNTSLTNTRHFGVFQVTGDNYFNIASGRTCVGCDSTTSFVDKFRVNGSMSQNIDSSETITSLGSDFVQVIDASTGKFKKITGANLGVGSGSSPYIYQFVSTQQVTVSNTTTETTIYGTGEGSAGIDGSSDITTGTQIVFKGGGTIDTDGSSAGTPTLSFKFPTSTVSFPITGLANGLNDAPYTYEYKVIPLGTGTSQSYIWQINFYCENNFTPIFLTFGGRETSTLTTTGTVTVDVTVEWDTADTDNTWVADYNTVEIFKK